MKHPTETSYNKLWPVALNISDSIITFKKDKLKDEFKTLPKYLCLDGPEIFIQFSVTYILLYIVDLIFFPIVIKWFYDNHTDSCYINEY